MTRNFSRSGVRARGGGGEGHGQALVALEWVEERLLHGHELATNTHLHKDRELSTVENSADQRNFVNCRM
jgi:hypothetical protein